MASAAPPDGGPLDPQRARALLSTLQLADSALPTGRGVHSNGLESWLNANPHTDVNAIEEVIASAVIETIAPLDGVLLAHAHRARTLQELLQVDQHASAHKIGLPAREASESLGRRLERVAPHLAVDSELLTAYLAEVRTGTSAGNVAVVQGAITRAMDIPIGDAVLAFIRGSAADLVSAGVRLGRVPAIAGQGVLSNLTPVIAVSANAALVTPLDGLRSTGGELELAGLAHRRVAGRSFAT